MAQFWLRFLVASALLATSVVLSAQGPDFSGTYLLVHGGRPSVKNLVMTVGQTRDEFRTTRTFDEERRVDAGKAVAFRHEEKIIAPLGGSTRSSSFQPAYATILPGASSAKAHFEGEKLVVEADAAGPNDTQAEAHLREVWQLSPDRKTLTVQRRMVGAFGDFAEVSPNPTQIYQRR